MSTKHLSILSVIFAVVGGIYASSPADSGAPAVTQPTSGQTESLLDSFAMFQSAQCGEIFRHISSDDDTSTLTSPNYGGLYPNNISCIWHLSVLGPSSGHSYRHSVYLGFSEFDTEACCDSLRIYDGRSTQDKLLRNCRGTGCDDVISSGPSLTVEFVTDSSYGGMGFKALWKPVPSNDRLCMCGRSRRYIKLNEQAVLKSPNYPNQRRCGYYGHQHDRKCIWHLGVPSGFNVLFNVTDVNQQKPASQLHIFDGKSTHDKMLQSCRASDLYNPCGGSVKSTSRWLTVVMMWNSDTPSGFNATWEPVLDRRCACGQRDRHLGKLTDMARLTSPNHPDDYCDNADCLWNLSVLVGYRVELTFDSFNTAGWDNVKIYDGRSVQNPLLRSCNGSDAMCSAIRSTGSSLTVHFLSDASDKSFGFSATWRPIP